MERARLTLQQKMVNFTRIIFYAWFGTVSYTDSSDAKKSVGDQVLGKCIATSPFEGSPRVISGSANTPTHACHMIYLEGARIRVVYTAGALRYVFYHCRVGSIVGTEKKTGPY